MIIVWHLSLQYSGRESSERCKTSNTTTQESKPVYFAVIVIIITAYERQGQEGTTATAPTSERGIVGHYKRGRSEACWTAAEMLPCSFSRYLSLAEYPLFWTSITMATVKALKRSGQPYLTHSSPPLKMHFLTLV